MSNQVVRVQGFTKGSLGNIGRESERANVEHRNPDIDPERTHLNMVYKETQNGFYAEWNKIMADLNVQYRDTKTGIAFEGMVITADRKFFEDKFGWEPDKPFSEELLDFWDKNYEWLVKEVGFQGTDANIISAVVHADETSLHMQAYYVPVVDRWRDKVYAKGEDGKVLRNAQGSPVQAKDEKGKPVYREVVSPDAPKLSRSEFWRLRGGATSYTKMQDRYHEEIGKQYGLERGEVGSTKEHRTKAQWETEQLQNKKEQLQSEVKDYQSMKTDIEEVDRAGRTVVPGYSLVKTKDLDKLKDQAKSYVANKPDLDLVRQGMVHLRQMQLEQEAKDKELKAKERKLETRSAFLDRTIDDYRKKYVEQIDLNNEVQVLRRENQTLVKEKSDLIAENKAQKAQISALKASIEEKVREAVEPLKKQIESLTGRIRGAFETVRDAVQAFGVLKHAEEDYPNYHVDGLTDQQGKLIDEVANFASEKAKEAGFSDIAEDIDQNVFISPEILDRIEPKVKMLSRNSEPER